MYIVCIIVRGLGTWKLNFKKYPRNASRWTEPEESKIKIVGFLNRAKLPRLIKACWKEEDGLKIDYSMEMGNAMGRTLHFSPAGNNSFFFLPKYPLQFDHSDFFWISYVLRPVVLLSPFLSLSLSQNRSLHLQMSSSEMRLRHMYLYIYIFFFKNANQNLLE